MQYIDRSKPKHNPLKAPSLLALSCLVASLLSCKPTVKPAESPKLSDAEIEAIQSNNFADGVSQAEYQDIQECLEKLGYHIRGDSKFAGDKLVIYLTEKHSRDQEENVSRMQRILNLIPDASVGFEGLSFNFRDTDYSSKTTNSPFQPLFENTDLDSFGLEEEAHHRLNSLRSYLYDQCVTMIEVLEKEGFVPFSFFTKTDSNFNIEIAPIVANFYPTLEELNRLKEDEFPSILELMPTLPDGLPMEIVENLPNGKNAQIISATTGGPELIKFTEKLQGFTTHHALSVRSPQWKGNITRKLNEGERSIILIHGGSGHSIDYKDYTGLQNLLYDSGVSCLIVDPNKDMEDEAKELVKKHLEALKRK